MIGDHPVMHVLIPERIGVRRVRGRLDQRSEQIGFIVVMTDEPLVVFTPSGKRGRFPAGTPILTAARQLGVDLDSVCGGRGICSKCQITPSYGEFPKHGVTVQEGALSEWNQVEQRYKDKRGLIDGRRLGCQATVQGDVVIDVPPESQVHRQVVRKRAEAREITMVVPGQGLDRDARVLRRIPLTDIKRVILPAGANDKIPFACAGIQINPVIPVFDRPYACFDLR